ncbi:hypothetical protein D3C87_1343660 [compost metagenome]
MALGRDTGRQQELVVDVQALDINGVADEHFLGQLLRLHIRRRRQGMALGHDQHLLIIEHGFELETRLEQRVRRDQQVDLVTEERADPAELELLLDVHIHVGPRRQIRRDHLQQPLVARMAFHAYAQRTALALRELAQALFGQVQLRQHAVRHRQQVLAGLRQAQAATFTQPDVGAQLLLQFLHAVAQGRLGQAQHAGGGRQRPLLLDLLNDAEMDTLKHSDEFRSWICEIKPFYFITTLP